MGEAMKKWFLNLSDREQQLVKYGAIVVLLALMVAFVFLPVNRSLEAKHHRLASLQNQGQQMQQILASAATTHVRGTVPSGVTFSAWLDQQMVALAIQNLVTRAEPVDENTMTLWLQNAPFDVVVDWLAMVEQQFGVAATQLDVVSKDKANGLSDLRMTLVK